jgi:hypothetical protein
MPSVRILQRKRPKRLEWLPGRAIITLAEQLVPLGLWERGLAYDLIMHHRGAQQDIQPTDIAALGRGIHTVRSRQPCGLCCRTSVATARDSRRNGVVCVLDNGIPSQPQLLTRYICGKSNKRPFTQNLGVHCDPTIFLRNSP